MSADEDLTTVYYFIPSDGDKEDNPNAFKVRSGRSYLTVRQIKESFPLPGSYYFRFKVRVGSAYAWMDPLNDDDAAPLYDDAIITKVLRIHWDHKSRHLSRLGSKQDVYSVAAGVMTPPGSLNATFYQPQPAVQQSQSHPPPPPPSPPPPPPQPPIIRHSMTTSGAIPSSCNNVDLIDLNCDHSKWNSNSGYI
ncbi:hypothetical protein OIY81_583 [Cryptosporidium canis]|nr:hypothetical protein OIY81_583 [Cryptosporidium canis]